jgi:hypothetical protein
MMNTPVRAFTKNYKHLLLVQDIRQLKQTKGLVAYFRLVLEIDIQKTH